MSGEVGVAYVSIVPSTKGFGSTLGRQVNRPMSATGRTAGGLFGKGMGVGFAKVGAGVLALGATGGLAVLVKGAVSAEAAFSQTMNTLAAATNTPKAGIKALSDLALKMGADTVFSAGDAANAMLELAKGGLTVAQIKGGALAETLTLAAAGGVDLATAGTVMSNAMATFGLSAKDAPKITAALAGGANSSTASIDSLGQALQQVGPGAKGAGLSIQETVGVLAAFDNAGIKGSDAGTSLKTMLTRLQPQTKKAAKAMRNLGLDFTDSEGNFLPIIEIAGQLKGALGGLSESQRTTALNQIFGSDAARAAGVLGDLGGGVGKYIKATKDMNAAQDIAKARMSGTKGALEQLRGSFETAQLRIGQALAPAIQKGAGLVTNALNGLADGVPGLMKKITDPFGTFQTSVLPKLKRFWGYLKNTLAPAIVDFAKVVAPSVAGAVKSVAGSIKSVLDTLPSGNGKVGKTTTTFLALRTAAQLTSAMFKIAATNVKLLAGAFKILTFIPRQLATVAVQIVGFFIRPILNAFGFIVNAAAKAFGWVPGLGPKLKTAADKFAIFKARAFANLDGFGAKGTKVGTDFTTNLAAAILGSNKKVSTATAVGTANKVRANAPALLGADARRSRSGGNGNIYVNVNNPKPERASESTKTAIQRATRAAGWAAA